MDISHIANVINEKSEDYKVGNLQYFRNEYKDIQHPNTYKLFSKWTIMNDDPENTYIFHSAGRKEFQVNIGYEKFRNEFRAGFAFSIEPSRSVTDPVKVFKPRIKVYNNYLDQNFDKFSDLMMFHHDENYNRSSNYPIKKISDDLIDRGMFIFMGTIFKKEADQTLTEKEYDHILKTLDRIYEIYKHIEKNNY
ncbi:MAG: hypothetical protein ACOCV1_07510 [Bacillota bacterium]